MSFELSSHLMKLITGFQVSQAISVAATLGIPDLLGSGPQRCDDLAIATRAQPNALYRLLRALASVGVLEERDDRQFALSPMGHLLRSDVVSSRGAFACLIGQSNYWSAWGDLLDCVRSGQTAFDKVHGTSVWAYRAEHPDIAATFDRAMGTTTEGIAAAVLAVLDLGQYNTIVDVGGGEGAFLTRLLGTYPTMRGVVFDQPHVVARVKQRLERGALAARCEAVGGDFFEAVPANADAYLLKWILHDWDDQKAVDILRSCRRAMKAGSRLIVVEYVIASSNEGSEAKFMDLNMMVITGGIERTRDEFDRLFAAASFKLVDLVVTKMHAAVLVAEPV
jgi:hypothetical protein